jgi:Cdc6-like AAA superfamily ATPase
VSHAGGRDGVKGLRASVGKVAQAVGSWAAAREHGKRTLRPLTAEFSEAQHRDYVDYLNESLHDSTIRNIALTGRYGSGKSSVLMQFAREHHRRVLVLSLSTLGHEDSVDENAGTAQLVAVAAGGNHARVNQIQKELVKQLLHREPPAKLPQSRYQRIARLTLRQAFVHHILALRGHAACSLA